MAALDDLPGGTKPLEAGDLVKQRRNDIDWLRILAMLGVFLLHCNRFFDPVGWHLKNDDQSIISGLFSGWVWVWIMPLFFLLSGAGSWYSLESRTARQYLAERVKRILIPLYTVGMIIVLPPQLYFELITNRGYTGSFLELFPRYVSHIFSSGLSFRTPFFFGLWFGHLWFLQFLFLVSLATLPLLLHLKSEAGRRLIGRLAAWCNHRGGVFLFLISLVIVQIPLRGFFRGEHTWADLFCYAIFFLIGYVVPADQRFTESFKRHGWVRLPLGIAGFGGVVFFLLGLDYDILKGEPFSLTYVFLQIVVSIASWSWVVFILGLGARYLNSRKKVVAYGNEAVLPFYILHQTVILLVGWFVIRWNLGIAPKFLIISVVSLVLVVALYELLIRHSNVARFFFGMRAARPVG